MILIIFRSTTSSLLTMIIKKYSERRKANFGDNQPATPVFMFLSTQRGAGVKDFRGKTILISEKEYGGYENKVLTYNILKKEQNYSLPDSTAVVKKLSPGDC